jgi:hypothetical protein
MKDIYKPVMQAIVALFLIVMVKLVSLLILKDIGPVYAIMDIVLSIGVVVVLLRFMQEFNRQLAVTSQHPEKQSLVTGIILLLVILIIYGTFLPYAYLMPYPLYSYGFYHIIFFFMALIPVYNLWKVIDRNTEKISDLLTFTSPEKKKICSCGWENPNPNKFCGKCGLSLEKS